MFSIRALFAVTLFVACMAALGQLGTVSQSEDDRYIFKLLAAVCIHILALWSILSWIQEVEQIRSERRRSVVFFADVTAFLMFAGQLAMAVRIFAVELL